ncbi:hypothetical protein B1B05_04815 [Domibacillus enclensis]|uniref:Uncharacterized protein n=1 Tax=Domibacillus enclensis TaxID=1017273 RepID=A0A1N6RMX7_9BACI|nr:hypothetical protein B1B05_04815 [Domibacillus enclensis]SIQ30258.1 hypothetical protein SAMN05443094_102173 [Domibacillus enclensis]
MNWNNILLARNIVTAKCEPLYASLIDAIKIDVLYIIKKEKYTLILDDRTIIGTQRQFLVEISSYFGIIG